jgi:hypothetical protein
MEDKISKLHYNCGYVIYTCIKKTAGVPKYVIPTGRFGQAKPRSQKEGDKGMTEIKFISSGLWAGTGCGR